MRAPPRNEGVGYPLGRAALRGQRPRLFLAAAALGLCLGCGRGPEVGALELRTTTGEAAVPEGALAAFDKARKHLGDLAGQGVALSYVVRHLGPEGQRSLCVTFENGHKGHGALETMSKLVEGQEALALSQVEGCPD